MAYHVCGIIGHIINDDTVYSITVPCWACAEKCSRRQMPQQVSYKPLTPDLRVECVMALRCVEHPRILAVTQLMRTYHILAHEMRQVLNEVEGEEVDDEESYPCGESHISEFDFTYVSRLEDLPEYFDFNIKGNSRTAVWEDGEWVIDCSGDPLYTLNLPHDASAEQVIAAAHSHPWEANTREAPEFPWGEFDNGGHWRGEALCA